MYKKKAESGLFLIHCFTDNKSLLNSVHSTETLKEMRLKIDIFIIREMLEKKEFALLICKPEYTVCRLFINYNSISKQIDQYTEYSMWHYQLHIDAWFYWTNFSIEHLTSSITHKPLILLIFDYNEKEKTK